MKHFAEGLGTENEFDSVRAWKAFEDSGKVTDYLAYARTTHTSITLDSAPVIPADIVLSVQKSTKLNTESF